jgi:16S rRNA (adenine1518-N6/adenine1519-N6)-dimethyltransferase
MTKNELLQVLASLDLTPSRRLGQNFLIDQNLLAAMMRNAEPRPGEAILEIGPGTGVLTRKLLEAGCRLTAVEFDRRLASYLKTELGSHENFRLIEGDACRVDIDELMGTEPYRCIANLPYSSSTVLLGKALELDNPPREFFVLLQREMAERLAAVPGTKAYGALTVRIQLCYNVSLVRKIPPEVFFPPPAVESAYVRLTLKEGLQEKPFRTFAGQLVRAGFSQRRKKMLRLLQGKFGGGRLPEVFAEQGISADARAESLSVEQFRALAETLFAKA